jgi:hypothetical protein
MTSENCWVMYDIEATVMTATPTELKLTASWPLDWLQAPNSIEIQRKLSSPVLRSSKVGGAAVVELVLPSISKRRRSTGGGDWVRLDLSAPGLGGFSS